MTADVRHAHERPSSRRAAILAHLELLFGDTSGYLYVERGRSRMPPGQKDWHTRSFRYPEQVEQALSFMEVNVDQGYDVYFCPYLGSTQARAQGGAVSRTFVHVDIDREFGVEAVAELGGFVVWSGTPGHAHVYVPLTRSVAVDEHERLCRGLIQRLGGDSSKVSDNDLLRPAGTHNYKVRDHPALVRLDLPGELRRRSPEALAEQLTVDLTPTTETHLDSQGRGVPSNACMSHLKALDRLSEVFKAMVVTGESTGYPSRSEARMAVTLHAHMVGFDSEEFAAMALDPGHGMSRWYEGRGRRLLDREWDKVSKKAAEANMPVPEKLMALRRKAFNTAFRGKGGASEYAVLLGIHTLATDVGRIDLDVSVRDAALYANVSKDTAGRAIVRLVKGGWLQQLRQAHKPTRQAARYRLRSPTGATSAPDGSFEVLDLPRADYWLKAGTTALQLFHHLLHRPMTPSELVQATGRSRQAVSRQLHTLHADGLLNRDGDGRWTVVSEDTQALSDRYGWTGAAQARAERHDAQRVGWDHEVRPRSSWYTPPKETPNPPDPPAELR